MALITNPLSDIQFARLRKSIEWSNKQFEFPRRKRLEVVKQYSGPHYAEGGAQRPVPVNFLKLAVDIYGRRLAARSPRVMITTIHKELKPTAANLELAINQIPDEIGLTDTLRRFVTEALFSIGILKVGLCTVGKALGHEYGAPFADVVTLDDYFCDASAKRPDQIQYEGNDYWLDYDEVMESDYFSKSERSGLKPDEYTVIGPNGESRADGIFSNNSADVFKDRVWLRDVWLPSEKLLVTYGVKSDRLLKTIEWEGPERGLYFKLGFSDVPGNLLPLSPASVWRDLHDLSNALFRKLGNQADGQKTVLGFQGGNEESVLDFQKARDGDGIRYSGAEPKTLTAGGVDQKTLAFYLQCRDLSSYFAGNLDSIGGLAPMTQTVGQDRLLNDAAGAQLRDMSARTVEVMRDIFQTIAWYEWHDPIRNRKLEKPIPGIGQSITVEWNRESRRGDFSLYDLNINVYSLQDDSPGAKLQKLGAIVQQYILPMAPMIDQGRGTIDVQAIFRDVARYSDMPEVNEYVTWADQSNPSVAKHILSAPSSGGPPQGPRERVGRPGMTPQGASAAMQQMLMGGNPNGSEMHPPTGE